MNPSISFTLSQAKTITSITYKKREKDDVWINFLFEGNNELSFAARIEKYFSSLIKIFPFLAELSFNISSENSFPHSSGIASSASSMSALALGLCSIESEVYGTSVRQQDFMRKASFVSRLGSGSACRSVYPELALWGPTKELPNSGDFISTPYNDVDPIFRTFHDDILIISGEKKSVSSTACLLYTSPSPRD